jgi:hypothetical protein
VETTLYSLSVLATVVTAVVGAVSLRRSYEGRALELRFVDAGRTEVPMAEGSR